MAAHLILLLLFSGLKGVHSITTVSKVSVTAGKSVSIPCLYESQYMNHVKYLCEGYYWNTCSYAVKTNEPDRSGKYSISDDKKQKIFTVTINQLTNQNTYYWCAVGINGGSDHGEFFQLSFTSGTSSLYVDHPQITGYIGENISIRCHHRNSGGMKWCRLGRNCVTGSSGSIDGTTVTTHMTEPNVFTVTMSGLKPEDSGWYWCAEGDIQIPVHLTVTEKLITRVNNITTVSKVSVTAGKSVSIPCLYESQYKDHMKYFCEGYHENRCNYIVKTNEPDHSGKYLISDDKDQKIFTVTINQLTNKSTDYWCVVEINGSSDHGKSLQLSVTSGTPSLYVDQQQITGYIGENITIRCHHRNSGGMKWCRLGRKCVTGSSGSIDGTTVTTNMTEPNVFTVTMSGLKPEDSGWYWCAEEDIQIPVHLNVTEKPITATNGTTTHTVTGNGPITTLENEQHRASSDLKILIIPLSVLILIVIVVLFIWLILINKPSKAESSATAMAEVEVTYSEVRAKKRSSAKVNEEAISTSVGKMIQKAPEEEGAEVTYSTVAIQHQNI